MRREDLEELGARGGAAGGGGAGEEVGLGDVAADVEGEEGGNDANPEHDAPSEVRWQGGEEYGVGDGGDARADGRSGLRGADGAATVFGADGFADEDGADRPFSTEAETLQAADDEELAEGVGEAAEKGEEGEPEDGELEDFDTAKAIGRETGEPASDGGEEQGGGTEQAGLPLADVPEHDEAGQNEAVDHDVHAVEHPAGEGGEERGALLG